MKKTVFYSVILTAIITVLTGCKKEDFSSAGFRFKIDGKEFIGTKELTTTTYFSNPGRIRIRTTKIKNVLKPSEPFGEVELEFSFDANDLSKTVPLGYDVFYYGNNGGDTYRSSAADPGTLVVTEFNTSTKTIKGTFSLTAYTDNNVTKAVTEGGFDLTYTE